MNRTITLFSFIALFTVISCVAGRKKAQARGKPTANCTHAQHGLNRKKDVSFALRQKTAALQKKSADNHAPVNLTSQQLARMAPDLAEFFDAQLRGKPCDTL